MGFVEPRETKVDGLPTRVWADGGGPPLLLVHGAWGGAHAHWAPVWDRLARTWDVVAPDLPGVAPGAPPGPSSFTAFAAWLAGLLDVLRLGPAVVVGNSLGAGIAARFASLHPERCRALVLVNGGPPPALAPVARRLLRAPLLRALVTGMFRRNAFGPGTLDRAFHRPELAPEEVRRRLREPEREVLERLQGLMLADEPPAGLPRQPVLLLYGARDRLWGSERKAVERLATRLPDAEVAFLPDAGHLPQVEQPEAFLATLDGFLRRRGLGGAPVSR